ncbi:MAG: hypothetical protein JJE30_14375 [Desulfuromonadales bacterium]|nr:hypothetical protein [Desulfuromonadales bacterium]
MKIHLTYLSIIFLLAFGIVAQYIIGNKKLVDASIIRTENITIFGKADIKKAYEGFFKGHLEGPRHWYKLDEDNLWVETYPERQDHIFHMLHKIKKEDALTPDNKTCFGTILQRVHIDNIKDEDRMYKYHYDSTEQRQIFVPDDIKCSQAMHRSEDGGKWQNAFWLTK